MRTMPTTVRHWVRRPLVVLVAVLLSAMGCDRDVHLPDSGDESVVPHAIDRLRSSDIGTVRFTLYVNGQVQQQELLVGAQETRIVVNASLLSATTNEIQLEFSIRLTDNREYPLATSTQLIPAAMAGETVRLSGLFYTYADSDEDGILNLHELTVMPENIDGDEFDNVDDVDSDGDGISYDGVDNGGTVNNQSQFTLLVPGVGDQAVQIIDSIGDQSEVDHLVNTIGELELRGSALWPDVDSFVADNSTWTAFSLGTAVESLCPTWRIKIDTSSLKLGVSRDTLLYFRRFDGAPFITPLEAGNISDFSEIDNDAAIGTSEWDDALRMILVREGTAGWLELWTEKNFAGTLCVINLST